MCYKKNVRLSCWIHFRIICHLISFALSSWLRMHYFIISHLQNAFGFEMSILVENDGSLCTTWWLWSQRTKRDAFLLGSCFITAMKQQQMSNMDLNYVFVIAKSSSINHTKFILNMTISMKQISISISITSNKIIISKMACESLFICDCYSENCTAEKKNKKKRTTKNKQLTKPVSCWLTNSKYLSVLWVSYVFWCMHLQHANEEMCTCNELVFINIWWAKGRKFRFKVW